MGIEIDSIPPYFILMAAFLLLGLVYSSTIPFYKKQYVEKKTSRYMAVDGLRGFLALGVMFAHGIANFHFNADHVWSIPSSTFYALCATAPVTLFFMITGFLFWSKAIKNDGKLNWRDLYRSRFDRLAPMYFFSILFLFVIAGIKTGWSLSVPWPNLILSLGRWFGFNFLGQPDINGLKQTFVLISGVIWTLKYEWAFTLVLPFIAIFSEKKKFVFLFFVVLVLYFFFDAYNIMNFLVGMLCSYLVGNAYLIRLFKKVNPSIVAIGSLFGLYYSAVYHLQFISLIFTFVFFVAVIYGGSLFGLLNTRGAQYLGTISYSIYLLHGLLLTAFFSLYFHFMKEMTSLHFWLILSLCGFATITMSSLTYRYIEYRFGGVALRR